MTSPTDKPAMRRALRARRDALTAAERTAASAQIAERAAAFVAERVARAGAVIALYAAKGSEVETAALDASLRARGFAVAYPRLGEPGAARFAGDADRRQITFHVVPGRGALVASDLGIPEPDASAPAANAASIAAMIVPGIAFDRAGHRLGWGRGHYDRALAELPAGALRVGLAFAAQIVDGALPAEDHDVALDAVVTEVGVHGGA